METPIDLRLLETFVAVAQHASFSRAATALGVAKGTVSRALAQLEEELGVELVHRTTRQVALSTAGAALYERAGAHLAALRAAVVDLPEREEAPSGLLRMAAPPDFGIIVLPAVIAGFARRFPAVRFDVRIGGAHVDLIKDGFDLAIRVATGQLKDSSLIARRVGRSAAAFYAAPSYLARRGRPRGLDDARHTWVLHHAAVRLFKLKPDAVPFQVDDFFVARDLVRDGVGVGMLPTFVARPYVREGLLEELALGQPTAMTGDLVMLTPSSGPTPKKVTAFRDFLVDSLRGGL